MAARALGVRFTKATGLARLAQHLGLEPSQVWAAGDHDNDVEMLSWAGAGVAMGNASVRALAAADRVAPTVQEDGVAVTTERFVIHAAAEVDGCLISRGEPWQDRR